MFLGICLVGLGEYFQGSAVPGGAVLLLQGPLLLFEVLPLLFVVIAETPGGTAVCVRGTCEETSTAADSATKDLGRRNFLRQGRAHMRTKRSRTMSGLGRPRS